MFIGTQCGFLLIYLSRISFRFWLAWLVMSVRLKRTPREHFCECVTNRKRRGVSWHNTEANMMASFWALEKPYGLHNGNVSAANMLITLCYIYLWVRFQKCYTGVIRSVLFRLRTNRSSLAFCAQSFSSLQSPTSPEDTVFLQLGNKVIYITEPQVSLMHLYKGYEFKFTDRS